MNYPTPLFIDRQELNFLAQDEKEELGYVPSIESLIELMVDMEFDDLEIDTEGTVEENQNFEAMYELYKICLTMEFKYHSIPHYFLKTTELKNFLIDTELKDYDSIKKFVRDKGVEAEAKKGAAYIFPFHLRIPNEECITYLLVYFEESHSIVLYIRNSSHAVCWNFNSWVKKIKPEDFTEKDKLAKLAFNTIYYMLCFPESITEGKPEGKKKNTGVKTSEEKTFQINPSIIEKTEIISSGRVTHFRKGHFRYLGSDYYVNKKGSYVFVHSSLVQGRTAKTIS